MPITFDESDVLFEKCYMYKGVMETTSSKAEFDEAKKNLGDLAGKLRSSSGEYTPTMTCDPHDKKEVENHIREVKARQANANDLLMWAIKNQFGE